MKKTIASLAAAGLLAAGFAGTAHADEPYAGTVETEVKPSVPSVVAPGQPVKVQVKVATIGNAKAKGTVEFVIRKPNGKAVKTVTRKYDAAKGFSLGKLPRGNYKVAVKFKSKKSSVYKNSREVVSFKVGR